MGMSSTQTTRSEPWGPAQPALKQAIGDAQTFYDYGIGGQPYTGSTVVPYSEPSFAGITGLADQGATAAPAFADNFANTAGFVGGMGAGGGLTGLQREAVEGWRPMAAGERLVQNNPFTQGVVDRSADLIRDRVGETASSMGRYGSGAHQGVLAREIGDMASRAFAGDYNNERAYQQDALARLFGAGGQELANRRAGTDLLSSAYAAGGAPMRGQIEAGGYFDDLASRQMEDELRMFNEAQNAPWNALARLNSVASGSGALGGLQQTTASRPPSAARGIGGALAGSAFGPIGAILGGLGGLLG